MPNVLPRGLFGRDLALGIGGATEPVQLAATAVGSTVPVPVLQVWCGSPTGVPVLVWSSTASPPTGVTATYTAGSHSVLVAWSPAVLLTADSYNVFRPDGSLVGSTATSSLTDGSPRPLVGSYTVVAKLGNVSAAPVASNSLDLRPDPVTAVAIYYSPTQVNVSWTRNASRKADRFDVYRPGGAFAGSVSSRDATAFTDTEPNPVNGQYYVVAVEVNGGVSSAAAYSNMLDLSGQTQGFSYSALQDNSGNATVYWSPPGYGLPDYYNVYVDNVYQGPLGAGVTSWSFGSTPGTVRAVNIQAVLTGQASGYPGVTVYVPAAQPTNVSFAYDGSTSGVIAPVGRFDDAPGVVSDYEAQGQAYQSGPPFEPWSTFQVDDPHLASAGSPKRWLSSYNSPRGYYAYWRVRTTSPGGPSAWLELGWLFRG